MTKAQIVKLILSYANAENKLTPAGQKMLAAAKDQ